jgi:hypothetical protein
MPITRGRWGRLKISTGGIEDGDTETHPLRSSFLFYKPEKGGMKKMGRRRQDKKDG